ncbi:MAG: GGDEF domain-containing protein [Planctomycetes bacterium]|nr:GGDEF domain-containing protein [Planctomycetota bacterium]
MLNGIQDLPTLPQVTVELIKYTYEEEPDIQRIASIIQRDATLTAKLFRSVNSAAFGLKVEVTSIPQAISLLGLETLKATIVSIAVGEFFINSALGRAIDPKEFCVHSLATAVIMTETAKLLNIQQTDQLFLVGLLNDLGMLILDTLDGERYKTVLESVEHGKRLEDAEKQLFGCDHFQAWKDIALNWDFPESLIKLKDGFVKGDEISIATQRLVSFSSSLADALGYYFIKPAPKSAPRETFLIPDARAVTNIGRIVRKQVNALSEILNLPAPDHAQLLELLWRMNLTLQQTNRKFLKAHGELKNRVEVLEELASVFTGIIRSLHSDSLAFSVIENLIEGFGIESAFLLHATSRGELKGYAAKNSGENEASVDQINLSRDEIPSSVQRCIDCMLPIKLIHPIQDEVLLGCLGQPRLIWLAPVFVRDRFTAILGVGINDERNGKFNSEDFGKVFHIISSEVGLSVENSRLYDRMKYEARTDPLTSISNRRTIMKILSSEFARFKRKKTSLTVAIFDMDNFKAINDNRGHLAGDEFLIKTARILKEGMRESDYLGRYGGDEFVAVFPDTLPDEARSIVERAREHLVSYCNDFGGEDLKKQLSVSAGIATAEENMRTADELINLADKALYAAKDLGRNRCVVHNPETAPTA